MALSNVFDVLEADHVARTHIENATLYNLDAICNDNCDSLINNMYNGPEVQFYNKGVNHKIYSSSYVINQFYSKYSYLIDVDLSNMYIAGGAVSQFVKHRFDSPDMDVFVYGLDVHAANIRVVKFINDIELNISTKYQLIAFNRYGFDTSLLAPILVKTATEYSLDLQHFTLTRTNSISDSEWELFINTHCIYYPRSSVINLNSVKYKLTPYHKQCVITDYSTTVEFVCAPIKIQVISRLYKTKQEILYGFDLGACAVGFDGKSIEFSIAGRFAHEYNLNILDTTRFSLNHGARLKKYFDRGYGVILPLCKSLRTFEKYYKFYIVRFYNMSFKYSLAGLTQIHMMKNRRYNVNMYTNSSGSDYSCDTTSADNATESRETTYLKNTIFKLANGYTGFYIYANIPTIRQFSAILTRLPTINLKQIEDFYKFMHVKAWKNGCLDMKTITSYIPEFNFSEFCAIVKTKSTTPGRYIRDAAIKQYESIRKTVETLGINENPNLYIGIKWTTSDVMSQKSLLTGSFHPVYMNDAKFYTETYYKS